MCLSTCRHINVFLVTMVNRIDLKVLELQQSEVPLQTFDVDAAPFVRVGCLRQIMCPTLKFVSPYTGFRTDVHQH